jgi:enamine deaminase RidA (YjgF/YER057c/UK114 family)
VAAAWKRCGRSLGAALSIERGTVKKEHVNPKELGAAPKFYSHAVTVAGPGKLIYVSGQISLDADGKLIGKGDMRAQSKQVFDNVTAVLRAAGATWDDVIKMNTYMVGTNAANVAAYREVRQNYLKAGRLPASTLVGVTALVQPELLLEVEVVAAVS